MHSCMEDVDYDRRNFRVEKFDEIRPLQITGMREVFPLVRTKRGGFDYDRDGGKKVIRSPRALRMLCIHLAVTNDLVCNEFISLTMPYGLYHQCLQEAILFGDYGAVQKLISTWPHAELKISQMISTEEIADDSLTSSVCRSGPCLLDYILLGLLNSTSSNLKCIDLTGFSKDPKVAKELCRLPLLWFEPRNRNVQKIQNMIKQNCYIERAVLERYLEQFNAIYQYMDESTEHEVETEPVMIIVDCQVHSVDVALGLALSMHTPFRFFCTKLWITLGQEYALEQMSLISVADPRHLTHLHLQDLQMAFTPGTLHHLAHSLERLPNLHALSLVRVINFDTDRLSTEEMRIICSVFNRVFRVGLPQLRRLDLSFSHLRDHLQPLLSGMIQPLTYLNLADSRISLSDLQFLTNVRTLRSLRELNLSMNTDIRLLSQTPLEELIGRATHLTCVSLSFCMLPSASLLHLVQYCVDHVPELKIACIQSFTPLPMHQLVDLLHAGVRLQCLQKYLILPRTHAFPGSNDDERERAARSMYRVCYSVLDTLDRTDIELVC